VTETDKKEGKASRPPLVYVVFWAMLVLALLSSLLWLPFGKSSDGEVVNGPRVSPVQTEPLIEHVSYRKTSEFDPGTIRVYLHNYAKRRVTATQVLLDGLPISVWGVDLRWDKIEPDPVPTGEDHEEGSEYDIAAARLSDRRIVWARMAPPTIPPGQVGELALKLTHPLPRPMKVKFVLDEGRELEALVRPVALSLTITAVTFSEGLDRIYVYMTTGLELPEDKKGCGCGQGASSETEEQTGPPAVQQAEPLRITSLELNGNPVTSGAWLSSDRIAEGEKQLAIIDLDEPLSQGSFVTVRIACDGGASAEERVRVFAGFPLNVETGNPPASFGLDEALYTFFPAYAKSDDPGKNAPQKPEPSMRVNYVFDCAMHKFAGDKARCAKETFRRYDICAKYDPHHPSLIHMCRIRPETGYALFGETTDILRINPNITSGMSKGREGETPEEVVERITHYAYCAARPRPVHSLADTAKFGESKACASPEELRRRVYTMLGCGVKGLLYRHRGFRDMSTPALDEEIKGLNAEIRHLRPHLAVADVVDWAVAQETGLTAHALLAGDAAVLVILVRHECGDGSSSPEPGETIEISLTLPGWIRPFSAARILPEGEEPAVLLVRGGGRFVIEAEVPEAASAYVIPIQEPAP